MSRGYLICGVGISSTSPKTGIRRGETATFGAGLGGYCINSVATGQENGANHGLIVPGGESLMSTIHQLVQHHGDNIRGALQRVGIDAHGDPRIGMAQALAHHRHGHSLMKEQTSVGVPHVVQGDSLDPVRLEMVYHSLGHAGVAQGRSRRSGEDQPQRVGPRFSRLRFVPGLFNSPRLQCRHQETGHGNRSHTTAALGLAHHCRAFSWPIGASQGVAHAEDAGHHVHVFPAQGKTLPDAQATAQEDCHHGVVVQRGGPTVPLTSRDGRLHGGQNGADIVTAQVLGLASYDGGALGQLYGIAGEPVVAQSQSAGAVEMPPCHLSAPVGAQLAEPHADRVHREAGELELAQVGDDVQPDVLLGALVCSRRPSRLFVVEVLLAELLYRDVAPGLGEHTRRLRLQLLELLRGQYARLAIANLASLWRADRGHPQTITALVNAAFALAPFAKVRTFAFLTHSVFPLEVSCVLY